MELTNTSRNSSGTNKQCANKFFRTNPVSAWALILANVTTMPFTITLNVLVIVCISRTKRLRDRNSNALLACLAVTDVLVGATIQPLQIASFICSENNGCIDCSLDLISNTVAMFLWCASILHINVISVERYISIKHALRYKSIVTTDKLKAAVIAAWVCSGCLPVLVVVGFNPKLLDFFYATFLTVSLFVIISCYVALFRESWRHKRMIRAAQLRPEQNASRTKEFKAMHTTALVVGSVLLIFGVIIISVAVLYALRISLAIKLRIYPWLYFLASLNSLVNPLIYFWRVDDLRGAVKRSLANYLFNRLDTGELTIS